MRKMRKLALVLAMTVCMSFLGAQPSFAETPREEVARLQNELNQISQEIEANQDDIGKQQQVRNAYQQQQDVLRQQIDSMNAAIVQSEAEIVQKQTELDAKAAEVAAQRALFEQRIVAQYMHRSQSDLAYLLGAANWNMRARFQENLQKIAVNDTEIEQSLRTQQAELERQRQEMQAALEQMEQQRTELAGKVEELASSIRQTDANISDAQAQLDAQSAAYGQTQEELEAANERLNRWLSENSKVDFEYGGGVFAWPLPGYSSVSSNFGMRVLWGYQEFHRGVDFPAPSGTPIVAAESGIVGTRADSSYGICVKINHGSGLISLYAHMSARAEGITDGAYVNKGAVIGYVGSTGRSGGNHLHFEVNLNGAVVTPWTYLNG